LRPNRAPSNFLPPNPTITVTSTEPFLPLPNSHYLRLHAAVCRVAHLSGAAEYLDNLSPRAYGAHGVGEGYYHLAVCVALEDDRRVDFLLFSATLNLAFPLIYDMLEVRF
jgi:hypothetical protein